MPSNQFLMGECFLTDLTCIKVAVLENVMGLKKVLATVQEALKECGDYEITLRQLTPSHS